jgi:hypothetical protein
MPRVSLSNDHGVNGAHGSRVTGARVDGEATYLNFADNSRKGYLFLLVTATTASSLLLTIRSQNTTSFRTCAGSIETVRGSDSTGKWKKKRKFLPLPAPLVAMERVGTANGTGHASYWTDTTRAHHLGDHMSHRSTETFSAFAVSAHLGCTNKIEGIAPRQNIGDPRSTARTYPLRISVLRFQPYEDLLRVPME